MTNPAQSLSPRAEFLIVVAIAFGYSILGNLSFLVAPSAKPVITNDGLQRLLTFELITLIGLGALLYSRGWRFSRVGPRLAPLDLGIALALAIAAYVISYAATVVAGALVSDVPTSWTTIDFIQKDIQLASLVTTSIVNPVFEELFLCGYVVTVLKERRGFWIAVNTSVAIRLACHLYQGPIGIFGILPLGFMFTYWYARTGRLWPVILAHAFLDVAGLWPYLTK